jgi:hypothetical protein
VAIDRLYVYGQHMVSSTLTAGLPCLDPANATVSYQWFCGDMAIPGARDSSYTVTEKIRNRNCRIGVRVTVKAAGYVDTVAASSMEPIARSWLTLSTTPVSGSTDLDLTVGVKYPPDRASIEYQWSKNEVAIKGATGPTYRASDDGAHPEFTVDVTVTSDTGEVGILSKAITPYGDPTWEETLDRLMNWLFDFSADFLDKMFAFLPTPLW